MSDDLYPSTTGDLLMSLAECLCTTLKEEGLPDVCFCGLLPGQQPYDLAGTECDQGQAWVRLVSAYPSQRVGVPDTTPGNCNSGLGYTVEVGVLRNFPITSEPLEDPEILSTSTLVIADMEAVRKAIICCSVLSSKDYSLGPWTPFGPLYGLVGGSWSLSWSAL